MHEGRGRPAIETDQIHVGGPGVVHVVREAIEPGVEPDEGAQPVMPPTAPPPPPPVPAVPAVAPPVPPRPAVPVVPPRAVLPPVPAAALPVVPPRPAPPVVPPIGLGLGPSPQPFNDVVAPTPTTIANANHFAPKFFIVAFS